MNKPELFELAELLGRDDPKVQSLLFAARSPGMHDIALGMLKSLCRQRGIDPDNPPAFGLPHSLSPGDYPLASAMCGSITGPQVGLSMDDASNHTGIFGVAGTGKTTFIKMLAFMFTRKKTYGTSNTFLILDMHGDYADLLHYFKPGEVIWLNADCLMLNPFEVPRGPDGKPCMPPDKWITLLKEWLRLQWLNEPSLNFFADTLIDLYRQRNIFEGGDGSPCLSNAIEAVKKRPVISNSDDAKAKGKVIDRLTSIKHMLPGLDVHRSRDPGKLFGAQSVILNLVETRDIALPFLFNFLVILLSVVFKQEASEQASRLLIMEEAHLFLGGQTEKRTADLKESAGTGVLRVLRKSGFCGVVVDQLFSGLAPSVTGNLSNFICFRLTQRNCIQKAASAMGLDGRQEQELARLPNRHAIIRLNRHQEPIYAVINDASAILTKKRRPSREEARQMSAPALAQIPYVKIAKPETMPSAAITAAPAKPAQSNGLNGVEKQILARISAMPYELIQDRIDNLGLDRDTENHGRARLETCGLIEFAGKVGAKQILCQLSSRGREAAEKMGLTVAKANTGKGSVVHEAIIHYTMLSLSRFSPKFRFQKYGISSTTDNIQPDMLLILTSGGRVPIQACYRNKPDYEAHALLKLQKLALLENHDPYKVDFVLAVAVNKRHKDAIERALRKLKEGSLPGRVVLLDFDTVIKSGFDWAGVMELPL